MKFVTIICALFITTVTIAQSESLFKEANQAYANENYEEAISKYQSILKEGYESTSVYYNLGNSHYKLNNVGPSVYYFEKALKLDPNDADLLDTALRETSEELGLVIARDQVIGQLEPVVTLNSGFLILPFVSVIKEIPTLSANAEVEKVLYIPLESFLKTQARDADPSHNLIQEMYTFEYQNKIVWGASARILKQIQDCLNV